MQEFYKDLFKMFKLDEPIICEMTDKNKDRKKFRKEMSVQYSFYANKYKDKEVVEYLSTIKNKRQYFINLIKKDIAESKKN